MSFKQRKMENHKRMNVFNVIVFIFVLASHVRNSEAACSDGDKEVNPTDCTSYYVCCSGSLVLKSCASGLYYDQDSSQCVTDNGQCIPTSTPSCVEGQKEVNPVDCLSYYECCGGELVPKSCASGLYYDQVSQECVPDNGQCIPTPTPDCEGNNTPSGATPGIPETPATPEVPVTPATPEVPVTPATPEVPVTPATPDVPVTPATPEVPVTPATPEVPVTPATPATPVTPEEPVTPATPEVPVTPATPEVPVTPATPATPVTPEEPVTPATPEVPVTPATPEVPVTPATPEVPITPATPETPATTEPCTEGERLINAQDCASYFVCTDGKELLQVCNGGDYFDKSTLACIPDVDDKCAPNGVDSECVGVPNNGLVPVQGNCSAFYSCLYGKVIQQTCPNNLHFNNAIKECDYPENAGCQWPSSPPSTGPSGTACDNHGVCLAQPDGTMFASATNACSSKYIVCQCECEIDFNCDSALVFNEKIKACDWPQNVDC